MARTMKETNKPATRDEMFALLEIEEKILERQNQLVESLRHTIFLIDQRKGCGSIRKDE